LGPLRVKSGHICTGTTILTSIPHHVRVIGSGETDPISHHGLTVRVHHHPWMSVWVHNGRRWHLKGIGVSTWFPKDLRNQWRFLFDMQKILYVVGDFSVHALVKVDDFPLKDFMG